MNWIVYVLNKSPTLVVKNMTPKEAWSGIKPSIKHFRIFGSVANRLYNPMTRNIIVSRDIKCSKTKKMGLER